MAGRFEEASSGGWSEEEEYEEEEYEDAVRHLEQEMLEHDGPDQAGSDEDELLGELLRELEARQPRAEKQPNMLTVTVPIRRAKPRAPRTSGAPSFLAVSPCHGTAVSVQSYEPRCGRPVTHIENFRPAAFTGGRLRLARPVLDDSSTDVERTVRSRSPQRSPPVRREEGEAGGTASATATPTQLVLHAGRLSTRLSTSALLYGQPSLVGTRQAAFAKPLSPRTHPIVSRLLERNRQAGRNSNGGVPSSSLPSTAAGARAGARAASPASSGARHTSTGASRSSRSAPAPPRRPRFDPASHKAFSHDRGHGREAAIRVRLLLKRAEHSEVSPEEAIALLEANSPGVRAHLPPPRAGGQFVRARGRRRAEERSTGAEAAGAGWPDFALDGSNGGGSGPLAGLAGVVPPDAPFHASAASRSGDAHSPLRSGLGQVARTLAPVVGSGAAFRAQGDPDRRTGGGPTDAALAPPIDPLPFVTRVHNPRWLWEQRHAVSRALHKATLEGTEPAGGAADLATQSGLSNRSTGHSHGATDGPAFGREPLDAAGLIAAAEWQEQHGSSFAPRTSALPARPFKPGRPGGHTPGAAARAGGPRAAPRSPQRPGEGDRLRSAEGARFHAKHAEAEGTAISGGAVARPGAGSGRHAAAVGESVGGDRVVQPQAARVSRPASAASSFGPPTVVVPSASGETLRWEEEAARPDAAVVAPAVLARSDERGEGALASLISELAMQRRSFDEELGELAELADFSTASTAGLGEGQDDALTQRIGAKFPAAGLRERQENALAQRIGRFATNRMSVDEELGELDEMSTAGLGEARGFRFDDTMPTTPLPTATVPVVDQGAGTDVPGPAVVISPRSW